MKKCRGRPIYKHYKRYRGNGTHDPINEDYLKSKVSHENFKIDPADLVICL